MNRRIATWSCVVVCSIGVSTGREARAEEAARAAPREETALRDEPERAVLGSAFVDPAGLLLFGPRVGGELGGERWTVGASARVFHWGLISRALFLQEEWSFAFSYGVALRGRYYLQPAQRGLHLGVAAELLATNVEQAAERVVTHSFYGVPHIEVGYRLPFGSFYIDGSAGAGYAFQLASRVDDLPGGSSAQLYEAADESNVYASAALDLGLRF
ncbi:hypothetical protein WME79_11790 [Sorangium sp. So ce726]|uniref:hypothetical protein n=1 Tax=Sorangium sp. So ce726 TaxID=3133319 RepID=UPI003F6305FB